MKYHETMHSPWKQTGIYNYCYCNKHNSYALLRENQDHLCEGCENRDAALLLLRRRTQKEITYSVAKGRGRDARPVYPASL